MHQAAAAAASDAPTAHSSGRRLQAMAARESVLAEAWARRRAAAVAGRQAQEKHLVV